MVLTAVLNPRFNFLNSNALRNKADFRTRERRAIIDITIPDSESYSAGGFIVDLSKIRNFIEVYVGRVIKQPLLASNNLEFRIEPGADAASTKVSVIQLSDGAELVGTLSGPTVISVEIIGI